jgi:radical SAM superfamily enzyme
MTNEEVNEMRKQFKAAIARVMQSGLNSHNPDSYFSKYGCDYCDSGLGATVYDVEGYQSLQDARRGRGQLVEFQLCADCINTFEYGN